MAASRIKGITVEIGGDTTKLQTALKGVNSSIKDTQSQLKDVEKLLKLDPGNTELLAQKQKLLADAVKGTKEKLETLRPLQNRLTQLLKTEIFHRNNMMLFKEKSSKQKMTSKNWKHKQISLQLPYRKYLLPVKS